MGMPSVQHGQPLTASKYVYIVSQHSIKRHVRGSLVDRGANGGILGMDARIIFKHHREVDVTGIDNHEMSGLSIVDASAKCQSDKGPVIIIMKQYAYHGAQATTIHSSGQIEAYKNFVDDRSLKVGGRQCIRTLDGYILPLDIIHGLPYLKMEPNSDTEWNELPHVILTIVVTLGAHLFLTALSLTRMTGPTP